MMDGYLLSHRTAPVKHAVTLESVEVGESCQTNKTLSCATKANNFRYGSNHKTNNTTRQIFDHYRPGAIYGLDHSTFEKLPGQRKSYPPCTIYQRRDLDNPLDEHATVH